MRAPTYETLYRADTGQWIHYNRYQCLILASRSLRLLKQFYSEAEIRTLL